MLSHLIGCYKSEISRDVNDAHLIFLWCDNFDIFVWYQLSNIIFFSPKLNIINDKWLRALNVRKNYYYCFNLTNYAPNEFEPHDIKVPYTIVFSTTIGWPVNVWVTRVHGVWYSIIGYTFFDNKLNDNKFYITLLSIYIFI